MLMCTDPVLMIVRLVSNVIDSFVDYFRLVFKFFDRCACKFSIKFIMAKKEE